MYKHKLILLIILLICSFCLTNCSDDSTGPKNRSVVGSWVLTKITMQYDSFKMEFAPDEIDLFITLTINQDKTYTTQTIDEGVTETTNGTWSIQGNHLVIEENNIVMDCTYTCTSSKLKIYLQEEDDEGELFTMIQEFNRQ